MTEKPKKPSEIPTFDMGEPFVDYADMDAVFELFDSGDPLMQEMRRYSRNKSGAAPLKRPPEST